MCISTSMINYQSLRQSYMSDPSVRHVRGTRFGSIRHDPEYTFTLLFIFLPPPPPVGSGPDDSPAISSLLLPTCMVREGDSSCHRIGLLPLGFVLPLLQFYSTLYLDKKSSNLF
jgi:hypothetical protein